MEEVWKPCFSYEHYYEVSNLGRVRNIKNKKIITGSLHPKGYNRHFLSTDGATSTILTHRLVANTFITNPLKKPCVNHIDGNRTNNGIDNLEWVTYLENNLHSIKTGRRVYFIGQKNPNSKLSKEAVIEIRENKVKGIVLANKFNVSPSTISLVRRSKTW